jgi:uncharacterized protein YecE (DUF72 family)
VEDWKDGKPSFQSSTLPIVHIGTSGWVYRHWADGTFYPPGLPQSRWFAHYAGVFDTVEINNSFYRLPSEVAFDHWREQAPPGFRYAVKANRYLTHVRRLSDCAEPLERFLERARRLGPGLGPILYQLPPRWKANVERLAEFAALLDGYPDVQHVFEFRDPRWFVEPVRDLLAAHHLSFCIYHLPDVPCPPWVTGPLAYLRFHGSGIRYGGRYTPADLAPYADLIRDLSAARPVYAYFNNDAEGYAVRNAMELRQMIGDA